MKIEFKASFLKAISKIEDNQLKAAIANVILTVEAAEDLNQIKNLKKLKGYKQYFRLRVGNYRIGIKLDQETIFFVAFDHRKTIYRIFPK